MTTADTTEFVIAALGASAGGLEPLETFFRQMPAEPGIAFVIIQHLAPDHETALPQLLGRHTEMPVEQAQDNTQVVPNRVYVIPPNATLTIQNGVLRVASPVKPRGSRTPIDSFFSSLAEDRGGNAVCIMLSGMGTDGTLGLRAIKEYGGMAMAQALETAKYDAILRSAIATGLVDHVLPVEAMPAKLLEYAAHLTSANGNLRNISEQIIPHMNRIHGLLQRRTGHDFSQYKESTIARRLERRMKALQIETVEQYVQALERQPEEADQLFSDLLIGVTHFFRDAEAFEALGREVIPKIFEGKGAGDQVRVCVVGCATGEEAYSIAILLCEHATTLKDSPKMQIFATDIDDRSLAVARKGRYPESIAEHVSAERLERFFVKDDDAYRTKRELRELCLFSSHSFIKDPPFSRLDLISCRNVLIYLGPDLQQRILPLFHYALRSGGYLFLGLSENVTAHRELFHTVDKKHRIFQRKTSVPRPAVKFPHADINRPRTPGWKPLPEVDERNLAKQLERLVLERYGPACVIVKENGDAVYFSARVNRYLQQPSGSPETNVINMARDGLRIPLRTSLHKAVTSRGRVVQKQISVQTNGTDSRVDLAVEPLTAFQADLYLIVFEEAAPGRVPRDDAAPAFIPGAEETIRHLEDELLSAHEQAQSAYEELETANEELQSANEEYQSTNEELETSKEELHSFNEELETVNSELNRKVGELDHVNSDLRNLLDSTQIATVFLDTELRIKKFTPAAGALFRLINGDIGRPLTDITAQFTDVDLMTETREVLRTLSSRERQLTTAGGRHFQMSILPYRTVNNVIDGVVLTFTDVSQIRETERLAEYAKTYAENIIRTIREPLLVLDTGLRVQAANQSFYDTFQISANQTENVIIYELENGQWDIPDLRRLLGEVIPEKKAFQEFQIEHVFPHVGRKTLLLNARQIQTRDGDAPLILLAIEDITERRRAENLQTRLAAIVESSDDAIVSKNLQGIILTWNSGAERLFGYSADEAIGKHISIIASPDRLDDMANILQRISRGERIEHYETKRRTKEGRTIAVSLTVSPILDSSGKVIGASKIARDITELKRTQDELQSLNADLKQFSYAASHDLQEPLRMVTSYTQLLQREYQGKLGPRADKFIAYAVEGALRMEALLRDLREYWSVNEQKVEKLISVDCNRVLERALAHLEASIQESDAVVTHASLPTVMAEELPLAMVFQNLIGNAIKYHRLDAAPRIHLSAQRHERGWKISVTDNGVGIPAEYLEIIFAPFKRLYGREYPGTGLGLAMCQKIVERYHGRIWAESTDGQGSTFHFTLPIQDGGS